MVRILSVVVCVASILAGRVARGNDIDYLPPDTYYSGATGVGVALKAQLTAAMSAGHILRNYGNFRDSAAYHDANPDHPGNILLAYNRASVPAVWDGGATWSREHVWPVSLQPGSAPSNSTTGLRADPHVLRPVNPGVNSSRGNKPFGLTSSSGVNGHVGAYYFPGDADKGDIARQLFYADTRWTSEGISLVNGAPGANQMGDLASLIAWHYLDPPDEFERHRNQAIYSAGLNPFNTNNRNAYIDHPEFAWSVYVDQMNDSRLYFGDAPDVDGGSTVSLNLGSVFVGAPVPTRAVDLHKQGVHGSYFEISTTGAATSSLMGRYNAFSINQTGIDNRSLEVAFGGSAAAVAGLVTGQVIVDNLDVTLEGGVGRGGNDADDVINLEMTVLDRSEGSFAPESNVDSLLVDLGEIVQYSDDAVVQVPIYNLLAMSGFTAAMDLSLMLAGGDTASLTLDLSVGGAIDGVAADSYAMIEATLHSEIAGEFSAVYTFTPYDDRAISGFAAGAPLTLQLVGNVTAAPEPATIVLLVFAAIASFSPVRRRFLG